MFLTSLAIGHDSTKDNLKWKQYFRMGTVSSENSQLGIAGYLRLKERQRLPLKIYGYLVIYIKAIQNQSLDINRANVFFLFVPYIHLILCTMRKTLILGINLRYHLNQGLGLIINENTFGNATIEAGSAFDNSDYLNTEQKTTYARSAISFDRKFQIISTKVEIDYFYQISEIYDNTNLSRLELLNECEWSFSKHLGLIAGFIWTIQNNNKPPSYFITISYKDPLSWTI